jgi:hypothetical protein
MTSSPDDYPRFSDLYFRYLEERLKNHNVFVCLPWALCGIFSLAYFVSLLLSEKFLSDLAISIPFYVGILTLNGLLLALAWTAFSRIYESVLAPKFSSYLRTNDLLSDYMFQIGYAHRAQLVAVLSSFFGLTIVSVDPIPGIHRLIFTIVVGTAAYAMKEACGAVTVMNELVWYKSVFDNNSESSNNVRPLTPRQSS